MPPKDYGQRIKMVENEQQLLLAEIQAVRERMGHNWETVLEVIARPHADVVLADGRIIVPENASSTNLGSVAKPFATVYADSFQGSAVALSEKISDQNGGADIYASRVATLNRLLPLNASSEFPAAVIANLDHGTGLDGLDGDDHTQYLNNTRHDTTTRHTLGSVVPHDNLNDLSEKLHASLASVTPDQHHAGLVALDGDSGSATPDGSDKVTIAGGAGATTAATGSTVTVTINVKEGIEIDTDSLRIDEDYGLTWTALHTFNAGLTIADGQNLNFGADVGLTRDAESVLGLLAGDSFRSTTYTPGIAGWSIDSDGTAEFLNVFVRGELHAAVFVKDLIEAHAGSLIVSKSGGVLNVDMAVHASSTWTMDVNDPPGGGYLFDNSDICRVKAEYASGIGDTWFVVSGRSDLGDGVQRYTCTWQNGTRPLTYSAGSPVLDYGVSGDGGLLMTADLINAPWMSIFTHAGAPWTTLTEHVRLGNINGLGDVVTDLFGIFIGDYAGDKWMSYDPTNSLRIRGDAIIDGTIEATTFTNNIGAMFFNLADGLLLLGPGCEWNIDGWTSLRGQTATISGVFHTEAGRWPGTRALVIEPATTNLVVNPVFGVNVTDGWQAAGSGAVAARDTSVFRFAGASCKLTNTDAEGWFRTDTLVVNPVQNDIYTATVWVRTDDPASVGDTARLRIYETGGAQGTQTSTTDVVLSQTWQQIEVTRTIAQVDRTGMNVYVFLRDSANNHYMYFDGVQCEESIFATSLAYGDRFHECDWNGDPHNSTTTRVVTVVTLDDHINLISANVTLSFRVVAQMPYDYDAEWPFTGNYLFDARGADDNNRTLLSYAANNNRFELYLSGSTRATATLEFAAGDWVDIVITLDYASDEYKIYLNGVLEDTDETALARPTVTDWSLGCRYDGTSNQGGFVIVEEAVFGRVLTLVEVAAIHNMSGPLVDAGANVTPGVYILDGQFTMASSSDGIRTEITPAGIGIYEGAGTTGIGRLLGGFVDTTGKVLDITSTDLGWFGYDDSDVLQVAWYGSGANAGKIVGGAGVVTLDSNGFTIDSAALSSASKIKLKVSTVTKAEMFAYTQSVGGGALAGDQFRLDGPGVASILFMDDHTILNRDPTPKPVYVGGGLTVGWESYNISTLPTAPGVQDAHIRNDLRVGGGIYVGDINTDPVAGTITTTDYMIALGGLHVGGTSNPGTDNLIVDLDTRIGGGLYVGSTGVDPAPGVITSVDYIVALGGLHVGGASDPGTDNLVVDGDTYWLGDGSGLPYGCLYVHEGAVNVDITGAGGTGIYVKITGLGAGLMNGGVSENSDAFRVTRVGVYKITWQISGDSQGASKDYEVDIFLNGVEQPQGSARKEFGGAAVLGSLSGTAIIDITSTSHDIDLRMKQIPGPAASDFDIFNLNFNIFMLGGT